MARSKLLSIPTRIMLGFLVVLLAFGAVAGLSLVQHNRTSRTLESLERGYLPLALTLGTAKATQAVYANLVERVFESDRTARTEKWLRAALKVRPATLNRAYEDLQTAEQEAASTGVGDAEGLAGVRRSLDGIASSYGTLEAQYERLFEALRNEDRDGSADAGAAASGRAQDAAGDLRQDKPTDTGDEASDKGAEAVPDNSKEKEKASGALAKGADKASAKAAKGQPTETDAKPPRTPAEQALDRIRGSEQDIQRRYQAAWSIAQQEISRISRDASQQQRRSTMILALLGLLALITGIAVTWLSQRVLRPIPLLYKRVADVAEGDLSSGAVPVQRNDELGRLVAEFERMVQAIAARDAKLREAALAERRLQRMQVQIVEALRAGVVLVDPNGVIRNLNPSAERILGLHPTDVGESAESTALFRRFATLEDALRRVVQDGNPVFLQGEPVTGFEERLVDVLVTPFGGDGHSRGGGLLIVVEDVTDAAATKSRLIQTERLAAIGRMAAHVTHEVRNPLSSIGLNVDLLKDELDGAGEESVALIGSIQQELDRLEGITEEYLRLARLPQPSLVAEDPANFLRDVASFVTPEMKASGVTLSLDVASPLPVVAMDEAQFRQALLNLLRNAREAMPDGGTVKLTAGRFEDGVRIEVHDEGQGVDSRERDRVFDLFYTTKERGTGLGLPLTQQIVAAHGGTIECKNRLPHGTTFVVCLPGVRGGANNDGAEVRRAV